MSHEKQSVLYTALKLFKSLPWMRVGYLSLINILIYIGVCGILEGLHLITFATIWIIEMYCEANWCFTDLLPR